jgi:hypothetical protein
MSVLSFADRLARTHLKVPLVVVVTMLVVIVVVAVVAVLVVIVSLQDLDLEGGLGLLEAANLDVGSNSLGLVGLVAVLPVVAGRVLGATMGRTVTMTVLVLEERLVSYRQLIGECETHDVSMVVVPVLRVAARMAASVNRPSVARKLDSLHIVLGRDDETRSSLVHAPEIR